MGLCWTAHTHDLCCSLWCRRAPLAQLGRVSAVLNTADTDHVQCLCVRCGGTVPQAVAHRLCRDAVMITDRQLPAGPAASWCKLHSLGSAMCWSQALLPAQSRQCGIVASCCLCLAAVLEATLPTRGCPCCRPCISTVSNRDMIVVHSDMLWQACKHRRSPWLLG